MNRVPPELINLENQMQDWIDEHCPKTTRIVPVEELPKGLRFKRIALPEPKPYCFGPHVESPRLRITEDEEKKMVTAERVAEIVLGILAVSICVFLWRWTR